MTDNPLMALGQPPIGWFEEQIFVRGCVLSLDDVKQLYLELSRINLEFGDRVIATLNPDPNLNPEQWEEHKQFLRNNAFCLTVSVRGQRDQQLYGENETIFSNENLPFPVKDIYFNNVTAWQRNASGSAPPNRIEVTIDFSKPALLDPAPLPSEPTPNNTSVLIKADDMTFFRAVRQVVNDKLLGKRKLYKYIHASFAYDFGLWLLVLPAALILTTYYMDQWFPTDGKFATYRWAFFIYAVGVALIFYRFLISYTKWAFPVTILKENKDTAWIHRCVIATIFTGLFWKAIDIVWTLLVPGING